MDEKEARYRKILFVILLVVIFVSILGTWTILSYIDNLKALTREPTQHKNVVIPFPEKVNPSGNTVIAVTINQPKEQQVNERGNN